MTTRVPWTAEIGSRPLWQRGIVAAGLAAGASALIYLLARANGIPLELSMQPGAAPALLPIGMVVLMSVAGAVGGTGLYALLGRVGGRVGIFEIVAFAFLLLSFAAPLTVAGAETVTRITLMLMHLVTGLSIIGVLTRAKAR